MIHSQDHWSGYLFCRRIKNAQPLCKNPEIEIGEEFGKYVHRLLVVKCGKVTEKIVIRFKTVRSRQTFIQTKKPSFTMAVSIIVPKPVYLFHQAVMFVSFLLPQQLPGKGLDFWAFQF